MCVYAFALQASEPPSTSTFLLLCVDVKGSDPDIDKAEEGLGQRERGMGRERRGEEETGGKRR